MKNNVYLNEGRYKKTKKKLSFIALFISILGLSVGGFLIYKGITRCSKSKVDEVIVKLEEEKNNVISFKKSIEEKIKPITNEIKELERKPFNGYNKEYYERIDRIDELKNSIVEDNKIIELLNDVLNEDVNNCDLEETKINTYTSKYCSLKNEFYDISDPGNSFEYYLSGGLIIFSTLIISWVIYINSRGREISAFYIQQSMPIAKEGIEEITPSISKASEEIAKGIKKGLNDADKNKR